jgi:hypothetical protein
MTDTWERPKDISWDSDIYPAMLNADYCVWVPYDSQATRLCVACLCNRVEDDAGMYCVSCKFKRNRRMAASSKSKE